MWWISTLIGIINDLSLIILFFIHGYTIYLFPIILSIIVN